MEPECFDWLYLCFQNSLGVVYLLAGQSKKSDPWVDQWRIQYGHKA